MKIYENPCEYMRIHEKIWEYIRIYENILESNSLNIVTDRYMLKNSHIDNYLCSDNDINRNIIKIRKIYSKLLGVAKYSIKNPQSEI